MTASERLDRLIDAIADEASRDAEFADEILRNDVDASIANNLARVKELIEKHTREQKPCEAPMLNDREDFRRGIRLAHPNPLESEPLISAFNALWNAVDEREARIAELEGENLELNASYDGRGYDRGKQDALDEVLALPQFDYGCSGGYEVLVPREESVQSRLDIRDRILKRPNAVLTPPYDNPEAGDWVIRVSDIEALRGEATATLSWTQKDARTAD